MITPGTKFKTIQSNKEYLIIEKHKVFNGVWRCIPTYRLEMPYKKSLIQCFSEDFITDCENYFIFTSNNKNEQNDTQKHSQKATSPTL
jgi:hypothetical protein